ncbi:ABC transporter permease [Lacticaseibacillus parakribbianus]|uniref:ABC transporter permease n=1 Tax=Lacticaseibacillus parakribbianus TaxID=2970927 RepID=UPI0021CB4058|nr:FtsX-like permease family protein [Lacticaseibacillus parakribbianus]
MFLALKELRKEKLRSGLIIAMIVLISYLIFILTSLALGLARQNTAALSSWGVDNVTLNANANVDMRQSLLTKAQAGTLSADEAYIGQASVVAKAKGHANESAVFIGLDATQFVAKTVKLTAGHKPQNAHQVVADTAFEQAGYKVGDQVKLNADKKAYTIVGFTDNAKMNIAPVIYGQLAAWRTLKNLMPGPVASAVVSKNAAYKAKDSALQTYQLKTFINKLPGYSAQNMTFELMIGFLMVISLIVIAVFLYILTMQKLPNYAVMRVQGVPSGVLVRATLAQSVLLVVAGLVIGTLLTVVTAVAMPAAVPMAFDVPVLAGVAALLVVMALIGGLIPVRSVIKVDPISVIGG